VQVVTPAPQPITVIVLVDVDTGQPFGRPTDGSPDRDATLPPRTGGSTTTTTRPGTTTTTPGSGSDDAAIRLVHDALQACFDALLGEPGVTVEGSADDLDYAAVSRGGGVYDVTVSERDGPDRGTWQVDTRTGDLTPQDQTAAEVGAVCPALA
jgi:hypothetical protein